MRRNSDEGLRQAMRDLFDMDPAGALRLFLRAVRAGAIDAAIEIRSFAFDRMEASGGFADTTGWHDAWSEMAHVRLRRESRNNGDEERRRREREAQARGVEPHLDVRGLSDRLRSGEASFERARLAALLGNETAESATGVRPDPILSAGFDERSVEKWSRTLAAAALGKPELGRVLLALAAYSAFVAFDLMDRGGFSEDRTVRTTPMRDRVLDAVREAGLITNAIHGAIQLALDGESLSRPALLSLGERANELWEEARWLQENEHLVDAGFDDLLDVASDLYILLRIFSAKPAVRRRMAENNLKSAASIWARGDRTGPDDWAEVSSRVIAGMILELLPELGRRPR